MRVPLGVPAQDLSALFLTLASQKIAIAEKIASVFKSQGAKSQVLLQKSQEIARKS